MPVGTGTLALGALGATGQGSSMPVTGGSSGVSDGSSNTFGTVVGPTINFGARAQPLLKPTWTGGYSVPVESRAVSGKAFDFPVGNTTRLAVIGLIAGLGILIIYRTR